MPAQVSSPRSAPRIAVVTADEALLPVVEESLASTFHTTLLSFGDSLLSTLTEVPVEAVIIDLDGPDGPNQDALDLMEELRNGNQDLVIFGLTRSASKVLRRHAEKAGVNQFFAAPVDFDELRVHLQEAVEKQNREVENRQLREQALSGYSFCDLIGGSESMRMVYDAITRVAEGNTTVLILGESGTGKELVARAIVVCSGRRDKPFISVNCAALPETLIEAELFGHEKGAFTGAIESRAGHIEAAHGGTLFLDEIGTLGLALQSKLLRVLEQRTVQRIGGKLAKKIDFRLITATNEDLEDAVRAGRFREDLYYRIHVVPIFLPPLRERAGDVPLLIDHFLHMYCNANGMPLKRLEPEALEILEDYHWSGNVRELENLVQRLVLMAPAAVITAKHLPQQILYTSTAKQEALLIPEEGINFDEEMARIEVAYLQAALRRTEGKKVAAAALLQIDPQKMKYLCRKYGIGGQ